MTTKPVREQDEDGRPPSPHTVSVVIPTRNRPESLSRTLDALARQDRLPDEVVVVDASDRPPGEDALRAAHPGLPIVLLRAPAGVCSQRNAGIRRARGSHVLLCDDDIEPPPHYLSTLLDYLDDHPGAGAVSGLVCEPDRSGDSALEFSAPRIRSLLFAFLFQGTVWGDTEAIVGGPLAALPLRLVKRWYRHRGNTWSAAGWPLVTQVQRPVFHTRIYGLGASLIRRDWLLASRYDERLGTHGIGDNYGVALGFPEGSRVAVLADLRVLHHRAVENRLNQADTYFQRVLALDYFMRTRPQFSRLNTLWLAWSLVGNLIRFALQRRRALLGRTIRALGVVVTGRNPILRSRPHP